jgi:hypothetical protein
MTFLDGKVVVITGVITAPDADSAPRTRWRLPPCRRRGAPA